MHIVCSSCVTETLLSSGLCHVWFQCVCVCVCVCERHVKKKKCKPVCRQQHVMSLFWLGATGEPGHCSAPWHPSWGLPSTPSTWVPCPPRPTHPSAPSRWRRLSPRVSDELLCGVIICDSWTRANGGFRQTSHMDARLYVLDCMYGSACVASNAQWVLSFNLFDRLYCTVHGNRLRSTVMMSLNGFLLSL